MEELLSLKTMFLEFFNQNIVLFVSYVCIIFTLYPFHYILIPEYYGKVINSFKDKEKKGTKTSFESSIYKLLFIYGVCWFFEAFVLFLQSRIQPRFTEYSVASLFDYILTNYEMDFENVQTGKLLSKIIEIPSMLFEYLQIFWIDSMKVLIVLFIAIFRYYFISKKAALVYTGFVVVNYIFIYGLYSYFVNKRIDLLDSEGNMYDYFIDCFQNFSSIFSFNQQSEEKHYFSVNVYKPYKQKVLDLWTVYIATNFFWGLITLVVFVIMNYLFYQEYKNKNINSELLISAFIITFSIIRLFEDADKTAWRIANVFSSMNHIELFFEELHNNNKNLHKKKENTFSYGDIVLKNIYHKYNNTFVLENVNLTIKKGDKVVIVGEIGSGKSTITKLLLGYQPITMGKITINDIDLNSISNKDIRKNIFYIPQKPKLFNRTLYENIVYGLENKPSIAQILEIMDAYGLKEIKEIFEEKMNQSVGVEGNSLSGGQRQIVWLLRCFFRQVPILILDEPTASLDKRHKDIIISIIKKLSVNKTVILISHDQIDSEFKQIKIKKGKIEPSYFF